MTREDRVENEEIWEWVRAGDAVAALTDHLDTEEIDKIQHVVQADRALLVDTAIRSRLYDELDDLNSRAAAIATVLQVGFKPHEPQTEEIESVVGRTITPFRLITDGLTYFNTYERSYRREQGPVAMAKHFEPEDIQRFEQFLRAVRQQVGEGPTPITVTQAARILVSGRPLGKEDNSGPSDVLRIQEGSADFLSTNPQDYLELGGCRTQNIHKSGTVGPKTARVIMLFALSMNDHDFREATTRSGLEVQRISAIQPGLFT